MYLISLNLLLEKKIYLSQCTMFIFIFSFFKIEGGGHYCKVEWSTTFLKVNDFLQGVDPS